MSRLVATEFVTLDGVMESPHEWSFAFWSDETAKFKFDELMASDSLLLGRVTYEGFAAAWPSRKDEAGFADRMNDMPKHVVSTTLENAEWNNSHIIRDNVGEEIAKLKQQPGKDIVLHGSAGLLHSLTQLKLVDEYRLMLFPIVLGKGKRLFQDGDDPTSMKLVETTPLPSGVIVLRYEPAAA